MFEQLTLYKWKGVIFYSKSQVFPEVREERLFGLSAFRRGNKRGYYYTGKRESLLLKKKKSHNLYKKEKSYLIKCLSSTHANETAQNIS